MKTKRSTFTRSVAIQIKGNDDSENLSPALLELAELLADVVAQRLKTKLFTEHERETCNDYKPQSDTRHLCSKVE